VLTAAVPVNVPVMLLLSPKTSLLDSLSLNEYESPLVLLLPVAFIMATSLPASLQFELTRPAWLVLEMYPLIEWLSSMAKLSSDVVVVSLIVITPESLTLFVSEADPRRSQ
jgi:hypothetical protein